MLCISSLIITIIKLNIFKIWVYFQVEFSFMFSWFWNIHKHFDNIWYSNLKTNFVELLPHVWKVIFNALFKFRHLYIQRTSSSFFLSSWLYIPLLSNIFTHTITKWGRTQIHSCNDYSFRHTLHRYMHTCKVFLFRIRWTVYYCIHAI